MLEISSPTFYHSRDRPTPSNTFDVASQILKVYLCPTDPMSAELAIESGFWCSIVPPPPPPFQDYFTGRWAYTNYAANGMVFGGNNAQLPGSFADGASNTIIVAERFQFCASPWEDANYYNNWAWGTYGDNNGSVAAFGFIAPPPSFGTTGMVAPVLPLPANRNDPIPLQLDNSAGRIVTKPVGFQVAPRECDAWLAQTWHPSGMPVALGDGSVRTLGASMSQWTFWAACTPAGG